MNYTPPFALVAITLALAGCAGSPRVSGPLGRSIAARPHRTPAVSPTPAPTGDPPTERCGTIPAAARSAEDSVTRNGIANTPRQALRRYALVYTTWAAGSLPAHERQLAATSIGDAKLTAQQQSAARSTNAALSANHVANSGQVIAIAPGEGPQAGRWVIVTLEHTTGTGRYASLPSGVHVTFAQVRHIDRGWVVSAWNPMT